MFQLSNTSFKNSKALNALVFDYISKKETLNAFYNFFSDKKGFSELLKTKPYSDFQRENLVTALMDQSSLTSNTTPKTISNIQKLKSKNTFTVTTGHQLCLFTGPLYFIYKLFSTINLAEELSRQFPESEFVPVYWMASEDHDFAEIDYFTVYGKPVKWESPQTGAVGDFKTEGFSNVLSLFKEIIGNSHNANYLIGLFEKYIAHRNLKDATRFLVNELFGMYGLIIADGNDAALKKQAISIFKKDIFENTAFAKVSETIRKLSELKYDAQVNPREINCFYMENGLRARIEKDGNDFKLVGTEKKFTREELEKIIETAPEKISPNVVLRPLYQQFILPNLAYVGGPGELAYWLEYKNMFDDFGIQFPILTPRNFVTIIDAGIKTKIEKLGFASDEFFKEEIELINQFQAKSDLVFDLKTEEQAISKLYASAKEKISGVDKTLINAVDAEEQKALKGLEIIVQKANKALKQRSETEINQIKSVKQKLFPGGVPQERVENFSGIYSNKGAVFFDFLKENLKPLNLNHNIITEIA